MWISSGGKCQKYDTKNLFLSKCQGRLREGIIALKGFDTPTFPHNRTLSISEFPLLILSGPIMGKKVPLTVA